MLNFPQNDRFSHHFHNPICAYNHPYNLQEKSLPLLQSIFTSLFLPYFITKSSLQYHSLLLHLSNFSPPNSLHQKIFSLPQSFSQFRLRQGVMKLGSLVETDTALISPFFLKVQILITGLTITDSLLFRLKIGVLQKVISDEDARNQNAKPSNSSSIIPSIYYY